jgi:hypothetical protein
MNSIKISKHLTFKRVSSFPYEGQKEKPVFSPPRVVSAQTLRVVCSYLTYISSEQKCCLLPYRL